MALVVSYERIGTDRMATISDYAFPPPDGEDPIDFDVPRVDTSDYPEITIMPELAIPEPILDEDTGPRTQVLYHVVPPRLPAAKGKP